jgi:serine/threonine protein kinase
LEHERIVVTIDGSFESFGAGSSLRRAFVFKLSGLLGLQEDQIAIISVKSGSIIVELGFLKIDSSAVSPADAVVRLRSAAAAGQLESLSVKNLAIGSESVPLFSDPGSSLFQQASVLAGIISGGIVFTIAVVFIFRCVKNKLKRIRHQKARLRMLADFLVIPRNEIKIDLTAGSREEGAFGVVYKGKWNGNLIALKTMKSRVFFADFTEEAKSMHKFQHPNIVRLYGVVSDGVENSLVMEWMNNGHLRQFLDSDPPPPMHKRITLFRHICGGVKYLHQNKIIHCDLKPENILLSDEDHGIVAKITDFGLSKNRSGSTRVSSVAGIAAGTLAYQAPEIVCGRAPFNRPSEKSDIYSLGVMFWEILSCAKPWDLMVDIEIHTALLRNDRPNHFFPEQLDVDDECAKLIEECWHTDPSSRPTAVELYDRVAVLDTNNPERNVDMKWFPDGFTFRNFAFKELVEYSLPPEIFQALHFEKITNQWEHNRETSWHEWIHSKYMSREVQETAQKYSLTEVEAKCIILYTMHFSFDRDSQFYCLYNKAFRNRNRDEVDRFSQYSYSFLRALEKLPDADSGGPGCKLRLYRGLDRRLEEFSELYYEDNNVCWHYTSSCSTDQKVAYEEFAKEHGTLLALNVDNAKSIRVFSQFPCESEFIVMLNTWFKVQISMNASKAQSIAENFQISLPDNVDLVIMDSMPRGSTFHQDISNEIAVEIHGHAHANISPVEQPPGVVLNMPPHIYLQSIHAHHMMSPHNLHPMPLPPHSSLMHPVYSHLQSPYPQLIISQHSVLSPFPPPRPVTHPAEFVDDASSVSVLHAGPVASVSGRSNTYRIKSRIQPPNSAASKPEFIRKKVAAKEAPMTNFSAIPQDSSDDIVSGGGTAVVPDTSVSIELSEQPEPFFLHRHAQPFDPVAVDDDILQNWDTASSFVRTISADGTRSITSLFRSELGSADRP